MSKEPKIQDSLAGLDPQLLEENAFAIYRELASGVMRGSTHEHIAIEAYRRAAQFMRASKKIFAGEVSIDPPAAKPRQMAKVKRQRAKYDANGFEDVVDPVTKQVVYDMLPSDPYAFAPNLPKDHPANARFLPEDGISFEERLELHRSSLRAQPHLVN